MLCRVESFALTANNVTYAVVGDLAGYWRFFPAADDGWGRVPVWGFGEIVASSHPEVTVGERYFGYWPMSSHLLVEPSAVSGHGFVDGTAHRAELPGVYNRYQQVIGPPDEDAEARQALLWPLFTTSFLIDDWLGEQDAFGADTVVVSSASSRTALGLAHLLRTNARAEVVGLTSPARVDFVTSTDVYDGVVSYGDLPVGLGDGTAVYVDIAGDARVTEAVHRHFGERLRRSVRVGFTHHEGDAAVDAQLPGPSPELFFAPDHVTRRAADWGGAGLTARVGEARTTFERGPGAAIEITHCHGADAVAAAWVDAVDGHADPSVGLICSW